MRGGFIRAFSAFRARSNPRILGSARSRLASPRFLGIVDAPAALHTRHRAPSQARAGLPRRNPNGRFGFLAVVMRSRHDSKVEPDDNICGIIHGEVTGACNCRRLMVEDWAAALRHPRTLLLPKRSARAAKKLPESLPISSLFSRSLDQAPLDAPQATARS